jgi:hypothetical protein
MHDKIPTPAPHLRDAEAKLRAQRPSVYVSLQRPAPLTCPCRLYERLERRNVRNVRNLCSCVSPWTPEVQAITVFT